MARPRTLRHRTRLRGKPLANWLYQGIQPGDQRGLSASGLVWVLPSFYLACLKTGAVSVRYFPLAKRAVGC